MTSRIEVRGRVYSIVTIWVGWRWQSIVLVNVEVVVEDVINIGALERWCWLSVEGFFAIKRLRR